MMARYKENRIGLRWRTEKEVISGKGQFECGNKKCSAREGLRSYEVNFAYTEAGESKQALVKLRVCPKCTYKLNYRKEKELEKRLRKESRRRKRKMVKERRERGQRSRGSREKSEKRERESRSVTEDDDTDDSSSSEELEESRFRRTGKEEGAHKTREWQERESKEGEFEPFFKGMFL